MDNKFTEILYPILNNKIWGDSKFAQFNSTCKYYNIKATKFNRAWLTGYLDGHGNFDLQTGILTILQKSLEPELLKIINSEGFNNIGNYVVKPTNKLIIDCNNPKFTKEFLPLPFNTPKMLPFNSFKKY